MLKTLKTRQAASLAGSTGGDDAVLQSGMGQNAITDETAVVSLMWANNETGVLNP